MGCKAYLAGNKTISANTSTALDYDGEVFDTDGYHSNSTNPSRFTIPSGKGGYYRIDAQVWFNTSGTGWRSAVVYKNGTQDSAGALLNATSTESTAFTISWVTNLAVGDYIQIYVYTTEQKTCSSGELSNSCAITFLGA